MNEHQPIHPWLAEINAHVGLLKDFHGFATVNNSYVHVGGATVDTQVPVATTALAWSVISCYPSCALISANPGCIHYNKRQICYYNRLINRLCRLMTITFKFSFFSIDPDSLPYHGISLDLVMGVVYYERANSSQVQEYKNRYGSRSEMGDSLQVIDQFLPGVIQSV